jgi:hypothetical protein
MKSSVTKTFRKRLNQLPATVQEQAEKAYAPYPPHIHYSFDLLG